MARKVSIEIVADYGSVVKGFSAASKSAKDFDRSLGSSVRGAVAGTGVFHGLGRSLAFASGGFLAFAGISNVIHNALSGAESLKKAQEGLAVSIEHTGGSLKTLEPRYEAVAKGAQQFGINQADALTALNRATVLTGNAAKAQRAYQEALVISKATGKDFNNVLTATAKGQEGITTSLKRYGIEIAKGASGQQQFNAVFSRFQGQAKANTSTIDRFNATLQNTEEIVGTVLLPILNKYLGELGKWLDKMTKTGQLQKEVKTGAEDLASVLHTVSAAVGAVDRVTGGFANTLKLLIGLKLVSYLRSVALGWDAVALSAGRAKAAEIGAAGAGGAGAAGAAGGFIPFLARSRGAFLGTAAGAAVGGAVAGGFSAGGAGRETQGKPTVGADGFVYVTFNGKSYRGNWVGFPGVVGQALRNAGRTGVFEPSFFPSLPGFGRQGRSAPAPSSGGPFGSATPTPSPIFKSFQDSITDQIAQAQAALTKTNTDDVAAARKALAYVRKVIASGHLAGQSLIQALQAEAGDLNTIWSAEAAAAQKRAAAAAKVKARIQAAIQNSIDPIKLEVELSREQATGRSTLKTLEALRAAARKALRSGKLSLQQQKQAWDQIASLNQQIKDALDKGTSALGGFHQASTRALTAGLGLTAAQRKALRARLSQLGPGGTVPNQGVGAFGYQIGSSGRPIHVHTSVNIDGKKVATNTTRHQQRHSRRNPSQRRGPNAALTG